VTDLDSLKQAREGTTHVIHCAGCTKAVGTRDFYAINEGGTRNVVEAINTSGQSVQRLVHVSSLAASGPGTREAPATEKSIPKPVSHYGRSKLAAEQAVIQHCRTGYVIVRPPAVYGPRDRGFLSMFSAVANHVLPRSSQRQALSLVYVEDLAGAILRCLEHPGITGRTFFAASPEVTSGFLMAREIARQHGGWTIPCPLPPALFWPVCAVQDGISRLTGRAAMLSLQKFQELRAPGWVCSADALQSATGYSCQTPLTQGIGLTLAWYKEARWL
jgi:nucleoside-diphosphate-sugar epimerase